MSYQANFDSARTFMKVGRTDKALESLNRALGAVTDAERTADNDVYLRILSSLAKIHLSESRADEGAKFLEQGLKVKPDHCDLLFLKALLFFDRKAFDEMLAAIVMYFLSLAGADGIDYEYVSDKAFHEIYANLLPTAYQHSMRRAELADVIRKMAQATNHPALVKAVEIIAKVDQRAGQAAHTPRDA